MAMKTSSANRAMFRRANASIGALLIGLALVAALIGQIGTPYDPIALDFNARLVPPAISAGGSTGW